MAEPVLIWGAGAMGGTLGAYWARAGIDVLMVDIVSEHAAACHNDGLWIEGPVEDFKLRVNATTPDQLHGRYSRVVLAVKSHHTTSALETLEPHLTDDGHVLSVQNGLNEIEIAARLGASRTMGAFVNFGADWLEPGHILFGNRGTVVIGEIDGISRERTKEMHSLMQIFEERAIITDNIWGFLWGKLAYGSMLFATALNMDSMSDNFGDPDRFEVWRKLGLEVMEIAEARGIEPVGFDGFDPSAFSPAACIETTRDSIAQLAQFNQKTAKTHSGVWRDLAVRKRRTEIDAQIGIISRLASEVGRKTPAIDRLVELVHDIEDGRREQSAETFNELLVICR